MITILSTIPQSYPQGMLLKQWESNYTEEFTVVDKQYNSKDEYMDIDIHIPQIVHNTSNSNFQSINDKIIQMTEEWLNDVKKNIDELDLKNIPPLIRYGLASTYEFTNTEGIISFYIDYYQYTGGAHGYVTKVAYNIDAETGKELKLNQLFKEKCDYKSIINTEIEKQINKTPEIYFIGDLGFHGIDANVSYYIKSNELVIYYQLYEIAPYVTGFPQFSIDTKIFNENYLYNKINNM